MSVRVTWEGRTSTNHSLEIVNREILARLGSHPGIELCDPADADITVRHGWPLNFKPPVAGRWVVMQPWEYGSIPERWLELFRFAVDEVWVYSEFNRAEYIAAGLPSERVRVVPLGVSANYLETENRPFEFRSTHGFRFLFVGATILRKGIDVLLDAYLSSFSRADDVCLVIKDFGTDSYYRNQNHAAHIRELQRDPLAPAIEYIDRELSVEEMHSLYRSCDALVHPYRGEGFGLPIAEAMASGLQVIATDTGGAAGFCTDVTARLIPSRRKPLPRRESPELTTASAPWWMEPDRHALMEAMRGVFTGHLDGSQQVERARRLIEEQFTWVQCVQTVGAHLQRLADEGGEPLRHDRSRTHRLLVGDGVRLWEQGDAEGALTRFCRAAEIEREDDLLFNMAAASLSLGDHRSAASLLQELEARRSTAEDEAVPDLRRTVTERAVQAATVLEGIDEIVWRAPIYGANGYADESRNFLRGVAEAGLALQVHLDAVDSEAQGRALDEDDRAFLARLPRRTQGRNVVEFQHITPEATERPFGAYSILRTMFETDGLPRGWAERCNLFDEVWVPSEFNRETFASSGVLREKMRIVPGCFDTAKFDRRKITPFEIRSARGFRFLSVFDFEGRKGWDLLLRAFAEEFAPREDVTLVMKVTKVVSRGRSAEQQIRRFLARHGLPANPNVVLIDDILPERQLLGLYAACDAFVLPSRGEGWGRPYMEAMALGLPTIGTRWSSNLEFMNDDNSFLVEIDGLEPCELSSDHPTFGGQNWAAPSVSSLREQMRRVVEDRATAQERAARAVSDVARYDRRLVGREIVRRLSAIHAGQLAGCV